MGINSGAVCADDIGMNERAEILKQLSEASYSLVEAIVELGDDQSPFEEAVEQKLLEMIDQMNGIRRMLE